MKGLGQFRKVIFKVCERRAYDKDYDIQLSVRFNRDLMLEGV
jgi:hypothetical protein